MTNSLIPFSQVLSNLGDDQELLDDTIDISVTYLPQYFESLRQAIESENPKSIEAAAHKIKGSLSIYLYQPLIQSVAALEKSAKENNTRVIPLQFQEFTNLYHAFLQELLRYQKK